MFIQVLLLHKTQKIWNILYIKLVPYALCLNKHKWTEQKTNNKSNEACKKKNIKLNNDNHITDWNDEHDEHSASSKARRHFRHVHGDTLWPEYWIAVMTLRDYEHLKDTL